MGEDGPKGEMGEKVSQLRIQRALNYDAMVTFIFPGWMAPALIQDYFSWRRLVSSVSPFPGKAIEESGDELGG